MNNIDQSYENKFQEAVRSDLTTCQAIALYRLREISASDERKTNILKQIVSSTDEQVVALIHTLEV